VPAEVQGRSLFRFPPSHATLGDTFARAPKKEIAMKNNLAYSQKGLALTKSFEGLRLTAYKDCVGVLTIGYGHTGPELHPQLTISEEQADQLLQSDIAKAAAAVNQLVAVGLTQNQFDALVDFVFNLGPARLAKSTLLRELNAGRPAAAADQFSVWVHAGDCVLPGLVARRKAERELFLLEAEAAQGIASNS
jgi:lysozyme